MSNSMIFVLKTFYMDPRTKTKLEKLRIIRIIKQLFYTISYYQ